MRSAGPSDKRRLSSAARRVTIGVETELEPFGLRSTTRIVPAADEVTITIRLIHREGYDRPIDVCEERCLKEIRARLRDLGIHER